MATQMLPVDPDHRGDDFYRYKMPAVQVKVESSGNGIKTVIANIHEICLAINRPEEVLMKYFQYELGAQSTVFHKDDKFLLMGSHTAERMQEKIYDFVRKFVLCKNCRNPETKVEVEIKKKLPQLSMVCGACGTRSQLSEHRVLAFMGQHYFKGPERARAAKGSAEAGKKDDATATTGTAADKDAETIAAAAAAAAERDAQAAQQREHDAQEQAAAAAAVAANKAAAAAAAAAKPVTPAGVGLQDHREHPSKVLLRDMHECGDHMEHLIGRVVRLMTQYNIHERMGPIMLLDALLLEHKDDLLASVRRYAPVFRRFATVVELYQATSTYDEKEMTALRKREWAIQRTFLRHCSAECVRHYTADKMPVLVFLLFIEGIVRDEYIAMWAHDAEPYKLLEPAVDAAMKQKVMTMVRWLGLEQQTHDAKGSSGGAAAADADAAAAAGGDGAEHSGGDDAAGEGDDSDDEDAKHKAKHKHGKVTATEGSSGKKKKAAAASKVSL